MYVGAEGEAKGDGQKKRRKISNCVREEVAVKRLDMTKRNKKKNDTGGEEKKQRRRTREKDKVGVVERMEGDGVKIRKRERQGYEG